MSFSDLIESFKGGKNPNLIYFEEDSQYVEYVASVEVDCSTIPEYLRNLVSSYSPDYLIELEMRVMARFRQQYDTSGDYEIEDTSFKVDDTIVPSKSFRSIYCYKKINIESLAKVDLSEKEVNVKINLQDYQTKGADSLNNVPSKDDEKGIIEQNLDIDDLSQYDEWSFIVYQDQTTINSKDQLKISDECLGTLLFLKNKKGSWVNDGQFLEKVGSQKFSDLIVINGIITSDNNKKTTTTLETDLIDASNQLQNSGDQLFIDPTVYENNKIVFLNSYNDEESGSTKILFGLPNYVIDLFPDISLAMDVDSFEVSTIVTYTDLSDMEKTIKRLKELFDKKIDQLDKISVEIKNYDPQTFIEDLNNFYSALSDKVQITNHENQKLTFTFKTVTCGNKPKIGEVDYDLRTAEYKKCTSEFVDKQTNFVLEEVKLGNTVETGKSFFLSAPELNKKISGYLFANAKNILLNESAYFAKDFFKSLVYEKTVFQDKEGFLSSTFFAAAQDNLKQAFVTDPVNLIKFSAIRSNIAKRNFQNKSIYQIIKGVIKDIRNLKALYESILYKFDIKDLVDEFLQCFLQKHPGYDIEKKIRESFFMKIYKKFLAFRKKEQVVVKALNGCGIPITGLTDTPLGIEQAKNQFIFGFEQLKINYGDSYAAMSSVIKCFDDVIIPLLEQEYPQETKPIKDATIAYAASQEARKILKQQWKLLVNEAKKYRHNPGAATASATNEVSQQKAAFKKSARNHWKLLQKQAVKFVIKIAFKYLKKYIKSLLKRLTDCRPKNKKKIPKPAPGSLELGNEDGDLILKLLHYISTRLGPDELCALFTGEAENEKYDVVLGIIKEKFDVFYTTTEPITYEDKVISPVALTNTFIVKEFLFLFSSYYPELTTDKCKKYFDEEPHLADYLDTNKCIDFSEAHRKELTKRLTNIGYSEEKIKKIIDQQDRQQQAIADLFLEQDANGLYYSMQQSSVNTTVPAADMVKEKINTQINVIARSLGNSIDVYKGALFSLNKDFVSKYNVNDFSLDVGYSGQSVSENFNHPSYANIDGQIFKVIVSDPIYFMQDNNKNIKPIIQYNDYTSSIVLTSSIDQVTKTKHTVALLDYSSDTTVYYQTKNYDYIKKNFSTASVNKIESKLETIFKEEINKYDSYSFFADKIANIAAKSQQNDQGELVGGFIEISKAYSKQIINLAKENQDYDISEFKTNPFNTLDHSTKIRKFIYFDEEKFLLQKNKSENPNTTETGTTIKYKLEDEEQ